jgi:hypothetical protein
MGLSRRKVVLYFYAITLIFLVMGFAAFWSRGQLIPVLMGLATLILLACAGGLHFSRDWFAVGQVVGNSLEMRQEIHYSLTLMRWLALEGGRRHSADELWLDLVFAAQRLGYTTAKLTLADGQRVWEHANAGQPRHSVVQVLQGGRLGTLELQACCCSVGADPTQPAQECEKSSCPCVSDGTVFEIVSELMAEGWVKGVGNSSHPDAVPLRFDTKFAGPRRRPQHKFSSSAAPSPVLVGAAKPVTSRLATGGLARSSPAR